MLMWGEPTSAVRRAKLDDFSVTPGTLCRKLLSLDIAVTTANRQYLIFLADGFYLQVSREGESMKAICILAALFVIVNLSAPAVHAQSSADSAAAPSSIFTVVPTPNGHPRPYQNDLHSVSASSASDIWAVGQTAIHFDGSNWKAFSVPGIHGDNTSRLGRVMDFAPNNV